MTRRVLLFFVLIFAVVAADAQTKKKKRRKKKPVVVEQVEPVQEVPAEPVLSLEPVIDTTTPPPLPIDTATAVDTPTVKPYVRIVLNIDSNTNLITYTGVMEEPESSSDSLYFRAKKWAAKTFAGGGKALYELDKKSQKLVINGFIPAYSYGKYGKREIGRHLFKMTILFREERYKFTISNLVHEGSKSNAGAPSRNYFEYYNTTNTNIKGVDNILRGADKDINTLIDEFKKVMKTPKFIDEDDW